MCSPKGSQLIATLDSTPPVTTSTRRELFRDGRNPNDFGVIFRRYSFDVCRIAPFHSATRPDARLKPEKESRHPSFLSRPPHPFIHGSTFGAKPRPVVISNTQKASARRSAKGGRLTSPAPAPRPRLSGKPTIDYLDPTIIDYRDHSETVPSRPPAVTEIARHYFVAVQVVQGTRGAAITAASGRGHFSLAINNTLRPPTTRSFTL